MKQSEFTIKKFIYISLLASIWQQISQFLRYLFVVKQEVQSNLSVVPNVATLDVQIALIWGIWVTLFTMLAVFTYYLYSEKFGRSISSIILSGTMSWAFFYLLFWVGMAQMNLSRWAFVPYVLVLAWIETVVTIFIADWLLKKFEV